MKNNRILIIIAFVLLVGASIVFALALRSPLSFAYYEPTYLPSGVSITEKQISIIGEGKNKQESARLRLETVAWTYSIDQYKLHPSDTIGEANQDFNETSVNPTCNIAKTPGQAEYRLCHWVDDWSKSHGGEQVSVYEVKFIKGSTYFWGKILTELDKPIPVTEIERFIDSFERKSIDGIPVQRSKYFS